MAQAEIQRGGQNADGAGRRLIPLMNFATRKTVFVDSEKALSILNAVGRPVNEPPSGIFLAADRASGNIGSSPGTIAISDERISRDMWTLATGTEYKIDSSKPPLAPRDMGNYLARLLFAEDGAEKAEIRLELQKKIEEYKQSGDWKSVRYLENLTNVMEKEAMRGMRLKRRLDEDAEFIRQREKSRIEAIDILLNSQENFAKDDATRRKGELSDSKNAASLKSIIGYATSIGATLIAAGTAIWEMMPNIALGYKVSLSTATIGAVVLAVSGWRKWMEKKIKETTDAFNRLSEEFMGRRNGMKDKERELIKKKLDAIEQKWYDEVKVRAISCASHSYKITIDFFPDYAKAEAYNLSGREFDFANPTARAEAVAIFEKELKGNGSAAFDLNLD